MVMLMNFFKLKNPIQNYAWGSKTTLQELFGIENPDEKPQAEVWMGAHPNGCSKIRLEDKEILLSEFIAREQVLSMDPTQKIKSLPYLFKVISAEKALSIQVHPNKIEAEQGFLKEQELGIDLSAPNRNYKDTNHKPELVYALTSYQAMNGFRTFDDIVLLFSQVVENVNLPAIQGLLENFEKKLNSEGLKSFFTGILSLKGKDKQKSIQELVNYAREFQQPNSENDIFTLILELEKSYPNDIGLYAPLLLNVVTLAPGEAMYLDARTPHAYLKGTGLEVMANSDNVLRAGLTKKHIDISELVCCTLFEGKSENSLLLRPEFDGIKLVYPIPVSDFSFNCFVKANHERVIVKSAEILFAIDSLMKISHISGETLIIERGESIFIPAYAGEYTLSSTGRVARVFS